MRLYLVYQTLNIIFSVVLCIQIFMTQPQLNTIRIDNFLKVPTKSTINSQKAQIFLSYKWEMCVPYIKVSSQVNLCLTWDFESLFVEVL
jgi:hypothetical protein